jgi:hypothetical protein
MSTGGIIALIVIVVVAVAAATFLFLRLRTHRLRRKFGPEYERTVRETGDRFRAESKLKKVEKRVGRLNIRPLSVEDRARFVDDWRAVQSKFVDDPRTAVTLADALVAKVMSARGYPVSDFEHCAEDISVDHPLVVQHYRAAHEIALRHARGQASTEELRQALIHYRTLFDDLLVPSRGQEVRIRKVV